MRGETILEKAAVAVYLHEKGFEPKAVWAFSRKISVVSFPIMPKKTGFLGLGKEVKVEVPTQAKIALTETSLAIIGSNVQEVKEDKEIKRFISPHTQAMTSQLDLKEKKAIAFVVGSGDCSQFLEELSQQCTNRGAEVVATISFEPGSADDQMELAVTKLMRELGMV
ncbi:TPA: hypothetical protein HA318_05930 [Candidatus Micrarchaeota archaeon]|nr:hypothetical protein [Candidatus Micrarchaeota archaeon]